MQLSIQKKIIESNKPWTKLSAYKSKSSWCSTCFFNKTVDVNITAEVMTISNDLVSNHSEVNTTAKEKQKPKNIPSPINLNSFRYSSIYVEHRKNVNIEASDITKQIVLKVDDFIGE